MCEIAKSQRRTYRDQDPPRILEAAGSARSADDDPKRNGDPDIFAKQQQQQRHRQQLPRREEPASITGAEATIQRDHDGSPGRDDTRTRAEILNDARASEAAATAKVPSSPSNSPAPGKYSKQQRAFRPCLERTHRIRTALRAPRPRVGERPDRATATTIRSTDSASRDTRRLARIRASRRYFRSENKTYIEIVVYRDHASELTGGQHLVTFRTGPTCFFFVSLIIATKKTSAFFFLFFLTGVVICGAQLRGSGETIISNGIKKGVDNREDSIYGREMAPVMGVPPPPPAPHMGPDGLILPRKPYNPCLISNNHKDLRRELLFNQKAGRNVLNQKSELQRALEKQRETAMRKEAERNRDETYKDDPRTTLQRALEQRAKQIQMMEQTQIVEPPNPLVTARAKLRTRTDSQ